MRNIKYITLLIILVVSVLGCKKFLNVVPIQAQSGNNFWQSESDVEKFTLGIYARLKEKIGGSPTFFRYTDKVFFPVLEMRGNFLSISGNVDNATGTTVMASVITNNLRTVVNASSTGVNYNSPNYPGITRDVMNWKAWYDIIAASNIMYVEIDKVPANAISETQRKKYKAEAVFLRNLSYMFICKLFGDAIYYTDAYNSKPLPRTPQVTVMNNCIKDMLAAKDDLPIAYTDQSSAGFRPTRGSAVALLMHLNMWASAWDIADKNKYYNAMKPLAAELDTYSNYAMLDVTPANTLKIFKGRSSENLFGVAQEYNIGEGFSFPATYSYFLSHDPYARLQTNKSSYMVYSPAYISKLYPLGSPDNRVLTWFENYDSGNFSTFQFKKFANLKTDGSGVATYIGSDDSAPIFRLPDCYLLTAEALAELGEDEGARTYLNRVRASAGAPDFLTSGEQLKEDVFTERCRELIGEGQFFFDLVRTKRATQAKFCGNPLSVSNFNAGAWTWPLIISATDRQANPYLIGNNFWN